MKRIFVIIFLLVINNACKSPEFDINRSVLLVVDIQQGINPANPLEANKDVIPNLEDIKIPEDWVKKGYTPEAVRSALVFAKETAMPNSIKTVELFHSKKIPIVYLRWGSHNPKALDMEPKVRKYHEQFLGNDPTKWGIFDIKIDPRLTVIDPGIEVIKTGHDGFTSSNLEYVLKNLNVNTIFLIGGHTNACYLATAKSAKDKGYYTISVEDATTDALETTRISGIKKANFNQIIKTEDINSILNK